MQGGNSKEWFLTIFLGSTTCLLQKFNKNYWHMQHLKSPWFMVYMRKMAQLKKLANCYATQYNVPEMSTHAKIEKLCKIIFRQQI